MKKLATAAAVLGLTTLQALAGGYVAPIVEVEPIVVDAAPAASAVSPILPAALLVGAIAVVVADDDSN